MGDMLHRFVKNRIAVSNKRGRFKLEVPRQRAYTKAATRSFLNTRKSLDSIDIDKKRHVHESEIQHRHEALPTGYHLGQTVAGSQCGNRVLNTGGANVREGSRFHADFLSRKLP